MGLDATTPGQEWLAWQINDATFVWGEYVEALIDQNTWRDSKGTAMYKHNIAEILGIGENSQLAISEDDIEEGGTWEPRPPEPGEEKKREVYIPSADDFELEDGTIKLDNALPKKKKYAPATAVQRQAKQRGRVNAVRRIGPDGKLLPYEEED